MKHLSDVVLASAVIIVGSTVASAEKWSCDMEMSKGKLYKQEWIVSDDKMFAPKGKGFYRVVLNDSDTLLAFKKMWSDPAKDPTVSSYVYIVIAKSTGVVTEIQEMVGFDYGTRPEQWMPPLVTVGHCLMEQP